MSEINTKFTLLFLSSLSVLALFLVFGQASLSTAQADSQDDPFMDSDAITYYSNPSNFINKNVNFSGKILTLLSPTSGLHGLQMYQAGDTTRNTIVIYDGPLQLSQGDCVMVTGVSQPITEYLNVFGATLAAAAIKADSISKIDCSESIEPANKIVNVNRTQEKNSIKVTLNRVDFSDENTRAHLTIENLHPSMDIVFYDFNSRAIQGKTQFITVNSFDVEYPRIESIIPAGIEENGVVIFEPLDPTESEAQFRFDVKDSSYENIRFIFDVILSPLEFYDKALDVDPNDTIALNNKGVALFDLGNYTGALEFFDRVLAIDPNDTLALNNKDAALINLGKNGEAMGFIDKALAIDPNDINALSLKGQTLNDLGRYSEAMDFIDRALAIDIDYASALNNKGLALMNLGNYTGAIHYYEKALDIDPNDIIALIGTATVHAALNDRTRTMEYLDRALEIYPDNPIILELKTAFVFT